MTYNSATCELLKLRSFGTVIAKNAVRHEIDTEESQVRTNTRTDGDQKLYRDIEQLRSRKKRFLSRLEEVLRREGDVRHLVTLPVNPRDMKVVLCDYEKNSRVELVNGKRDAGYYKDNMEMLEEVADKMLARLWNLHIDE